MRIACAVKLKLTTKLVFIADECFLEISCEILLLDNCLKIVTSTPLIS